MPQNPKISIATRIGWVSFFNDCSSEVIARAMPLLLTSSLGMTPTFVGVVEGAAEALSIFVRGFSGWFSDKISTRKPLVVFGYSLSLLSRVMLLAMQVPLLFALGRMFDRTGKGMRSAPRDAMVADGAAAGMNGRAFGITRFLDTLGAVTGITVVLLIGIDGDIVTLDVFRKCIWIAIPFGVVSVLFLLVYVPNIKRSTDAKKYLAWQIPTEIRGYLLAVGIFALGNSSDAFIVLRASELGMTFREILALMIALNLLAAFLAIPIGHLSDRIGRVKILFVGWLTYAGVYFCIGAVESTWGFILAVMSYGAFYGFTEGTEKALLADLLPSEKRGTGFGALQLTLGMAALPASFLTGWLMTKYGSKVAFNVSAGFAILGTIALLIWSLPLLKRQFSK